MQAHDVYVSRRPKIWKGSSMDRKWKTAFLTILEYREMDPGAVIQSLKGLGYEGVEWTMDPHFDPDKPISELKELVERTHDAGMGVSQIMCHEDLVYMDEEPRRQIIDRISRTIQAAGECGVEAVSVLTGPEIWETVHVRVNEDMSASEAWGQAIDAFKTFLGIAEECNVKINSEPVYGMLAHDFFTHKWFMDQTPSPMHKVNLDPSHHVLYGIEDMRWLINQYGDLISHVHVKDAIGIPELNKFVFPLLGEGRVNWDDFFQGLDELDYRGYCSCEFESFRYYRQVLKNDPEAAARVLLEQLNVLVESA